MSTPKHTTALFVRIPAEQARRLDRAAFALGRAKQEIVSTLLETHVNPDSAESLAALSDAQRRVTVDTFDGGGLQVGHVALHPRDSDVLTLEQAAELLAVDTDVVAVLAADGQLPGRLLGDQWRFARRALLDWLAAPAPRTQAGSAGGSAGAGE